MIKSLVDLRGNFGPARDQNPRPTCMAFAASDAHAALAQDGRRFPQNGLTITL